METGPAQGVGDWHDPEGGRWHDTPDNPLSKELAKLLKELKLHRPGLNFYALRHTFETVGGESRDQVAVDHIMGHVRDDMASVYRERIGDERLQAVTDHVRAWLFPPAKAKGEAKKGGGRQGGRGRRQSLPRPRAERRGRAGMRWHAAHAGGTIDTAGRCVRVRNRKARKLARPLLWLLHPSERPAPAQQAMEHIAHGSYNSLDQITHLSRPERQRTAAQ